MSHMFPCESRMSTREFRVGCEDIKWDKGSKMDRENEDAGKDSKEDKDDGKRSSKGKP